MQTNPPNQQHKVPAEPLCTYLGSASVVTIVDDRRLALAGIVAFVPFYYIFHSNKSPGSEQAAIKQKRRAGDYSNEHRDPRDSDVKTLEQKTAKEQGGQ